MSVRIIEQVIETILLKRGTGTKEDPIRKITQYWDRDGTLLAEVDPVNFPWKPEDLKKTRDQ